MSFRGQRLLEFVMPETAALTKLEKHIPINNCYNTVKSLLSKWLVNALTNLFQSQ